MRVCWCCDQQALVIRDWAMLWVLSIGFELMELTFQHMLPNFNECWWDSWVLDVAVCNLLGRLRTIAGDQPTNADANASRHCWPSISFLNPMSVACTKGKQGRMLDLGQMPTRDCLLAGRDICGDEDSALVWVAHI